MEMNRLEAGTFAVWDEFYKQMARVHKYVRGRERWPWNHKYVKQFESIAQFCIDADLSVARFVETALGVLRSSNKRFITPKDLDNPDLFKLVESMIAGGNSGADYAGLWRRQLTHLHRLTTAQSDVYPDAVTALMVPSTPFDAWFRVLLLVPFNEELFQVYGAAARQELMDSRALRTFLRQQTPDNMRMLEKRTARFVDG